MNDIYPGGEDYRLNEERRSGISRFFNAREYKFNRLLFFVGNVTGLGVLGYLLMSQLFSLVLKKSDAIGFLFEHSVTYRNLLEILYTFFCVGLPFLVVFAILKKTKVYQSFNIPLGRAYPSSDTALVVIAGLGVCFLGSLLTNYLSAYADSVGFGFFSYYSALEDTGTPSGILGTVILVLHSALVPAMVEEFAFRGVVMQSLRKFGDVFAIVSSAVLFGLIHGNMTQMPFAIVAGLALGYAATVTGTLKTSIIIHFLNNFVSVLVTLIMGSFGEGAAAVFSSSVIYGFIVIGLISLAVYGYRNPQFMRLRPGQLGFIKKKARSFYFAPVMIIAVLWLCWYILLDIQPVYYFFK